MQRKVFRVERLIDSHATARPAKGAVPDRGVDPRASVRSERPDDGAVASLERELADLNAAVAHTMRELAALVGEGHERHMAHAAGKLGAAVEGMEKATVKILKSAEVIDDSAKALAAAMKTDYERGLAQEIQDRVVQIYEACNFQDLSGQRIGNVIGTLTTIEGQVEGMLDRYQARPAGARPAKPPASSTLLNGPRLDGDSGHTSQQEIDVLFD
ncbi:MAG TPA: protein phosphatase CheZ [Pseudolabrys sp.]|nr:protein phosphatase CheZ [Pseudolabrys sp.]